MPPTATIAVSTAGVGGIGGGGGWDMDLPLKSSEMIQTPNTITVLLILNLSKPIEDLFIWEQASVAFPRNAGKDISVGKHCQNVPMPVLGVSVK